MAEVHTFDEAIALAPAGDHTWRGRTSPAYGNMIGPFGGLTAAQAMQAVLVHPHRLGDPVSFTANFAAALGDGEFTVSATPVRTNRSSQHWTMEMRQDDNVVLTATAVTGLRRETIRPSGMAMPDVPKAADIGVEERRGRVEWINRYEMRFVSGGFPSAWNGEDAGHSRTQLWLRDSPPRPIDFASLTALCDVFFPRVWLRRSTFVPVGTISMTVYFHASAAELQELGTGYLLGQAQAQAFHNGYFDQAVQMWTESGDLVATSHQVVYYKE